MQGIQARKGGSRKRWMGPVLASGILGITLSGAELAFALFTPVEFHRPLRVQDYPFERLHQASRVPGLEYELAPNAAIEIQPWATVVHTNRWGLRSPDVELEKPPQVFRIAAVGDSFTFGHGVPDESTFPRHLEDKLPPRADGRRYEVLNFGVSGYSSLEEAAVLRGRVGAFDPDLVLISYVLNDPEVHSNEPLHRMHHPPEPWERFHLTRRLAEFREKRAIAAAGGWFEYLHRTPRHWNTVVEAFESMRDTAAAWQVPVVLVLMPILDAKSWEGYAEEDLHRQVADLGTRMGFHVLDVRVPLAKFVKRPRAMRLPNDAHASDLGNRAFARVIRDYLRERFPSDF